MTKHLLRVEVEGACLLMVLALGDLSCAGIEHTHVRGEEVHIDAALKHFWSESKYTVVWPDTTKRYAANDTESKEQRRRYLTDKLQVEGLDLAPLVGAFIEANKTPIRLHLESTRRNGYLIDYTGEYGRYFKEGGGGWAKFSSDHPHADGMTELSRPVYDDRMGILLIEIGTQYNWKRGTGHVIVFKREGGILKELARVVTWES